MQHALREGYIRALPGPLAFAPSFLVPLATGLSIYGAANGHHLLQFLQTPQAPAWLPGVQALGALYTAHPGLCEVAINVLLSYAAPLITIGMALGLDALLGPDPRPHVPVDAPAGVYRAVLYAHLLLHWLLLGAACSIAGGMHPLTLLSLATALTTESGLVMAVAHDLIHSPSRLDRRMGDLACAPFAYMYFKTAHLAHHRLTGLREDNGTAQQGESLYSFLGRAMPGNLRNSVAEELGRLRARGLPILCWQNRLLQWLGCPLALLAGAYQLWGPAAAVLCAVQAVLSIVWFETVNYVAHYGLRRERLESGRLEPTNDSHSWCANHLFSNGLVLNIQRHSDHHLDASKPYQRLEVLAEEPTLPASWPAMAVLAMLPSRFFAVMDPLVQEVAVQQAQRRQQLKTR